MSQQAYNLKKCIYIKLNKYNVDDIAHVFHSNTFLKKLGKTTPEVLFLWNSRKILKESRTVFNIDVQTELKCFHYHGLLYINVYFKINSTCKSHEPKTQLLFCIQIIIIAIVPWMFYEVLLTTNQMICKHNKNTKAKFTIRISVWQTQTINEIKT